MSRKNRNYLVGSALPYEMINHQMITVDTSWYCILGKVEIWLGVTDALIYLYHDFHNIFPTFPSSSNTSCGLLLNGVFGPFFIEGRGLGVAGVVLSISDPSDKWLV